MKRKLSLDSFQLTSIRTQIVAGFGLILALTLIIVVINFVAIQNLQADIEATEEEAGRVRELSQEFQNQFLLARQAEQAFLDNWRDLGFENAAERYVVSNQEHLALAQKSLEELGNIVNANDGDQFKHVVLEVEQLGPMLSAYDAAFLETVSRIEERSRADGLEVRLEDARNDLESMASALPNSNELNQNIVRMSVNEQAYFNTSEQQYEDQTRLLALKTKEIVNVIPQSGWANSVLARPLLLSTLDRRVSVFRQLALLEQEIGINADMFQEITGDMNELTEHIGEEAAVVLDQARVDLRTTVAGSMVLSFVVGLVALGVGVLTAWLLARRIITPLTELTEAAKRIGEGGLETRVIVSGGDEFSTLGQAFNRTVEQLRDLIGSLEQLVAERTRALATSYQVSRRLSTILDQQLLVTVVVEQVRSAFDYYHAHIYFVEGQDRHLVMVGGTGEVGHAMLTAGHKLRPGQGLVGRAAKSGKTILVPDVYQDPNWLPNPLLPSTKSEIAVPIMIGDQVIGVLDVQHDVLNGLDKDDVELLQTIANQVAIALQNARLYEDAQRAAEKETTINIISQRIQQAGSVEDVLQIAAQELGTALQAQRTRVQLSITHQTDDTYPVGNTPKPVRDRPEDELSDKRRLIEGQPENGHPRVQTE